MILSENFVDIFFRFLNFGVLIVGLRYIYINYIVATVQDEIAADEKKVAIMAQQKDAYYQQEQHITQEIHNQRELVTHLMKKLEQWNLAADEVERTNQDEHERLEDALRKKAAIQSEHIAYYMLERRALPLAVEELDLSLAAYFKSDKRGAEYITAVIDHLKKER